MDENSNPAGRWRTGESSGAGFRQFYREWQPREERHLPVLALHGSLTQSGMWIELAERIGTVRLLCPDQRGYGASAAPQGESCADFARDALALADAMLPGRFAVMGHSFACSIALELAHTAAARIAGVVLVDPVVRLPGVSTPRGPAAPHPGSFATIEEAQRHYLATEEGEWTPATLARFTRDVMIEADGAWRFPYTGERLKRLRTFAASAAGDYDLFAKARRVRAPMLIFRGGASKRFAAAAQDPFVAAFPGSPKTVLCPASGHFPTATEPDIVAGALVEFLAPLR
jgi:pimeloyl-ACP methyl ester carboxylesterase